MRGGHLTIVGLDCQRVPAVKHLHVIGPGYVKTSCLPKCSVIGALDHAIQLFGYLDRIAVRIINGVSNRKPRIFGSEIRAGRIAAGDRGRGVIIDCASRGGYVVAVDIVTVIRPHTVGNGCPAFGDGIGIAEGCAFIYL